MDDYRKVFTPGAWVPAIMKVGFTVRIDYNEAIEDIEDEQVLRMVKGCFKAEKQVPMFRDRVDVKRFKTQGLKYDMVVNNTAIEIKEDV